MSTTSSDDEETLSFCTCGFDGFKIRSKVFHSDDCDGDEDSEELFEIDLKKGPLVAIREEECESSVFSIDIHDQKGKKDEDEDEDEDDVVCVAVGDAGGSSLEAFSWAFNHTLTSSTTLYLLHVFPVIRLIPSPMGKLPRSHVNSEYVNLYLSQERAKRKVLLQKFIDLCLASKVKVEMMLIEGDNVAKAIVDLVKNLSIRKLVIGATKSSLSKRRNAIADQVLKNAPENCDVKVICEGKDVIYQMIGYGSPRSTDSGTSRSSQEEDEPRGFVSFRRFFGGKIFSPR